jgi:hypothetical protein
MYHGDIPIYIYQIIYERMQAVPPVRLPERFGNPIDIRNPPQDGDIRKQKKSLILLENCLEAHGLSCADDRDRVYAVIFLANDYIDGDILINYDLPIKKVYAQVAKKYQSLRFLLWATMDYYYREHITDRTPSWVLDFRQ